MVSYLGAFPFQVSLAPNVLTFEAMVKVVVLLTDRHRNAAKEGSRAKVRLLFDSLADVWRKQDSKEVNNQQQIRLSESNDIQTDTPRLTVGELLNEDHESNDDLTLGILEPLHAVEVFKQEREIDHTIYEAAISHETLLRLLIFLLTIGPLKPLEPTKKYTTGMPENLIRTLCSQAYSILATFEGRSGNSGANYKSFRDVINFSLPRLLDPLSVLFEHFLFSKNLDLTLRKGDDDSAMEELAMSPRTSVILTGEFESTIIDAAILSQLKFTFPTANPSQDLLHNYARLYPVFSSAIHGESLTAFSHHVLTWQAPSLILIRGSISDSETENLMTVGAYIPQSWQHSSASTRTDSTDPSQLPCLFELSPTHTVLRANEKLHSRSHMPVSYFSPKCGIAIGCWIPPASRASTQVEPQPHGGGSLMVDSSLEKAKFIVSNGLNGEGIFLSPYDKHQLPQSMATQQTNIDIYSLEVWGIVQLPTGDQTNDEQPNPITRQKSHWEWEKKEVERKQNLKSVIAGGESDAQNARAILEMAGIISSNR